MLIETTMNLSELHDRITSDRLAHATLVIMRDLLIQHGYEGTDTRDVPGAVWEKLVEDACNSTPATELVVGQVYDPYTLLLRSWTMGDGTGSEGYNLHDYFDADGHYLGPDQHGIEPVVEAM